jgi:hypothetical protein
MAAAVTVLVFADQSDTVKNHGIWESFHRAAKDAWGQDRAM